MDDSIQITTTSWLDKYKPTKIDDLISNKKSVKIIVSWLDNFERNKRKMVKRSDGVKKKRVRVNTNDKKNKIEIFINQHRKSKSTQILLERIFYTLIFLILF